ncbi:MAG: OmpA family protein [Myxococcaceae bacterium]|nr:OmpA family protein [Myxococcaceae bacterium]
MRALISGFLLLCSSSVLAQATLPGFELERLLLNPSAKGGMLVGGADLLDERQLRIGLLGHYEHDPLVFVSSTGERLSTVVGSRVTAHLTGGYGITKWLEVGLQVPVVLWQGGARNLEQLGLTTAPTTVLGTPYLQARVRFLAQERGAPLDLGLTAMVGFPFGSAAGLTRDDTVTFIPRIGAGRVFGDWLRVSAELGGWVRPSQQLSTAGERLGSQLDLGVGATTLGEKLRGELSVRTVFPVTQQPVSAEIMAGARYPVGPIELHALAGPGIGRIPGTPLFRVLLGASWAWPASKCVEGKPYTLQDCPDLDLDGDGVKNAADSCPTVKGRVETAGCPDRDADGVVDETDQCPDVPGPKERKGCPPKDTDKDGLLDEVDECPTVPGPKERKGCPPKDSDADGVLDEVDACPTEPGPAERKGCPLKDSDGDGLMDDVDACPNEKGDLRYKGCPPTDQDKDGVEDAEDNCRTEPGPKENQGCPVAKKQLVIITKDKLVIKDRVYFDTAKATIQARSFPLLNQVATILKEHTEVQGVVVEGHTDSRGPAEYNRKLSQDRAESVKAYLVKQGVAGSRLDAKGYGPDRPVADNKTDKGRELNRRVEFVIVTEEKTQLKAIEVP